MDVTTLTIKILAVYLVVSGLFLIFKGKTVPHLLRDFFDHSAVTYLTGIILIFLSTMYLIQYNLWITKTQIVMSVFAWLIMLKGLLYVFTPKMLSTIAIKKSRKFFSLYGIIAVVAGAYLFMLN